MKTEVYSWRVSADLKTSLEREARRRDVSLSAVLDVAAREWLTRSGADTAGGEAQQRLHRAASKHLGALAGGVPGRSENARRAVRARLRRQHER